MDIAVCIATYQRLDGLRQLLHSLMEQEGLEGRFGIIVVDNDPRASAEDVVGELQRSTTSPEIEYIVEQVPGISAARNRAVARAREWAVFAAAFIDDDEFATPYWLSTMYQRLRVTGAAAISGPVEPIFPQSAPGWVHTTRLYHRATFVDGAKLDYASTANSMLRLEAIAGMQQPFNPAFGLTGGSDTFLYQTLRKRGGTIIWEPAGLVYENVSEPRLSLRWIVTRSYRQGITLSRCDRLIEARWRAVVLRAIRGSAQIPIGMLQAAASLIRRDDNWRRGLVRIARGLGMLIGLTGLTYEEYQRIDQSDDSSERQLSSKS